MAETFDDQAADHTMNGSMIQTNVNLDLIRGAVDTPMVIAEADEASEERSDQDETRSDDSLTTDQVHFINHTTQPGRIDCVRFVITCHNKHMHIVYNRRRGRVLSR